MTAEQTVGGYRLLRVIGEGGMGVVHLALDPSGRAVAVKVVRPHVAADPETRARLAREVRSLLRVRHPRVAEVLDADFSAELPYVVMRYVPGEALDAAVRRDGPLTGPALDELAVGLFEAVAAVHAVGVVHRDLKPGNVLLLDGSPVVIDFGIARALDDVALTSTGLMIGTPGYLSPEVLDGTDVGTAADWWGWGAVVAFAATGRAPFRGGPLEAVWDRVRRGAADLDGVDERWARLLRATLLPDPAGRPSPEQLAGEITALTGRRPELPAAARALAAGTAAGAAAARDADRAAPTRTQPRPDRPAGPVLAPTSVQARPSASGAPAPGAQTSGDTAPGAPTGRPQAPADAPRRPAARAVEPDPVTRVVPRPPPPVPPAQPGQTRPAAQPAQTWPPAQAWPAAQTWPAAGAGAPAATAATAPAATTGPTAWPTAPLPAAARPGAPAGAPWPPSSPAYAVPAGHAPAGHAPAASGATVAPRPGGGPGPGGAVVQPRRPAPGAPVPALPRRPGLALLGGVVVAAVAAAAPVGGAAVVLGWAALARSVQWSRVAAAMSRARSGRLGAGARTGLTLMYPFRLLGALAASAAYLLVGALVVSPLLLVAAAVMLRDVPWDSWATVQAVLLQDPVPAVLVVLGAVLAWVGPGGRAVRHGSRALTEPVARHRNGRLVLAGLAGLVVVSAVLVVTARL